MSRNRSRALSVGPSTSMAVDHDFGDDAEIEVVGPERPLIPPGEYEAEFLYHETHKTFGAAKVYVHFKIVELGPANGVRLYRAYNAISLVGRVGKGGRFAVGDRSALKFELLNCIDTPRVRRDRLSFRCLKGKLARVRVRTVTSEQRQRELPEDEQYSVIAELIGISAGTLGQ